MTTTETGCLCDPTTGPERPRQKRCWRCGCPHAAFGLPYALCLPCVEVVSPEEIAWMDDPARERGKATWEMTPLERPCGKD